MKSFSRHKLLIFPIVLSLTIHIATLGANIPGLSFPLSEQTLTARLYSDPSAESGVPGPEVSSLPKRIEQRGERAAVTPKKTSSPEEDSTFSENNSQLDKTDETAASEDRAAQEDAVGKVGEEIITDQQTFDSSEVIRSVTERLSFDIYWMGILVGASQLEAVFEGKTLTIRSETHSAAVLSTFYEVKDHVESRVVDGKAATFKIKQREGKYRSDKEVVFDPDNKTVTYVDHLKNIRKEHPVTAPQLWDVISAFYYLRTQPLIVGRTVCLNVFDSNKFLNVEVYVLAKEKVRLSDSREVDTVKIRPVLKSDGIFRKKGDILIWLTDDANRTPVRVETEVPVGKIVAKLKDFEQLAGNRD